MSNFEVGQEVIILDGTSLVGIVAAKEHRGDEGEFYAVRLNGYSGRWYAASDLDPAPATAPAAGVVGDYAKGYDAGLLDGYTGVDAEWVARFEARQAELERQLERGTAELRRYVEGNGFKWCEDEDTVFNVTTALGWMGGAIEALRDENAALKAQLKQASEGGA